MKKATCHITLSVLLLFISGCTRPKDPGLASFEIPSLSTRNNPVFGDTSIAVKKGDKLVLWAEMDVQYEGEQCPFSLNYRISMDGVLKSRMIKGFTMLRTSYSSKSRMMNKRSWSFSSRIKKLDIKEDGELTIEAAVSAREGQRVNFNSGKMILRRK